MVDAVFKQAAYAQHTDEVIIILVTLNNDEIPVPIRICSDPHTKIAENVYGCTSNGDMYVFTPFEIELPRDDNTGTVSAKLRIQNVDRQIIQYARSVSKPLNVTIQCVLASDLDNVQLNYDFFKLSNIQYDSLVIEGTFTMDYWSLEPFPSGRFTPSGFPGLF